VPHGEHNVLPKKKNNEDRTGKEKSLVLFVALHVVVWTGKVKGGGTWWSYSTNENHKNSYGHPAGNILLKEGRQKLVIYLVNQRHTHLHNQSFNQRHKYQHSHSISDTNIYTITRSISHTHTYTSSHSISDTHTYTSSHSINDIPTYTTILLAGQSGKPPASCFSRLTAVFRHVRHQAYVQASNYKINRHKRIVYSACRDNSDGTRPNTKPSFWSRTNLARRDESRNLKLASWRTLMTDRWSVAFTAECKAISNLRDFLTKSRSFLNLNSCTSIIHSLNVMS
jgi:hypothetical protein